MICASITKKDYEGVSKALAEVEMAEIRLDSCPLDDEEIEACFGEDIPLVATCRDAQTIEHKLIAAIEAGASYVDVELGVPKQTAKRIQRAARDNGARFIRSYHDFEGTDSLEALKAIVGKCRYYGGEIVKIVTTARSREDAERVMALYDEKTWEDSDYKPVPGTLIAFCMGEEGSWTRIECLKKGAPFTYAAYDEPSAPGQYPYEEMYKAVYGSFKAIRSSFRAPSSKSFAQRAIIAAALADGESILNGYTPCGDNEAALNIARGMGAKVETDGSKVTISGIGYQGGGLPLDKIDVGESGLLARLMIPLAGAAGKNDVELCGSGTLVSRKLKGVPAMMDSFGVEVSGESVPLNIRGHLHGGRVDISGKNGSQLISGLLMALPLIEKNTTVMVSEPKSIPYMFLTVDVLKQFGIRISNDMMGGQEFLDSEGDWNLCTEMVFKVRGGQKYSAAKIDLEGDWSAAANFLVAGAIFGAVEIEGLDTTSLQADLTIMDILMDAGACLSQLDGDKGPITVQRAPLDAFCFDATHCPDLFPIVSVLAAFCDGESTISGVERLSHKECDRGKAILEMLSGMGVDAVIEDAQMKIKGKSLIRRILDNDLLRGGRFSSCHDHRMVMALKVASLGASSPVIIDDEDCVAKSFPGFLECWKALE